MSKLQGSICISFSKYPLIWRLSQINDISNGRNNVVIFEIIKILNTLVVVLLTSWSTYGLSYGCKVWWFFFPFQCHLMIFIFNQIIGMHLTIHPYNLIEIVKDKQIQPFAITQEMTWGVSENQLESPLLDVVTITNLGLSFFLFPFYNHIQSLS
jgi:hypothetical protein